MRKCDIINEIEKLKSELYTENKKHPNTVIRQHNNGGIYWLNELKFRIENIKTKEKQND